MRYLAAISLTAFVSACTTLPPPRVQTCSLASPAQVSASADGTRASTTFDVLTFNIEGLGWPARAKRGPALARITAALKEMEARGDAPDIVMVQEMFSKAAIRAVTRSGYPNMVFGPSRTQRKSLPGADRMPGPYRWKKGELGLHMVGSGLAILSRYPIIETRSEPFGRRRCAGLDCLGNKGILYARVVIPGVPSAINLFNTHLNSQRSSRVSPRRHARAHRLQVDELGAFIGAVGDQDVPTILGGDFNMKNSAIRFERFRNVTEPFEVVQEWCTANPLPCDTRISWDGDEPWMDTQDLQLFESGATVTVTPIRVQAVFDGSVDSPRLSDHDGFRVTYRVSWNTSAPSRTVGAVTFPLCDDRQGEAGDAHRAGNGIAWRARSPG